MFALISIRPYADELRSPDSFNREDRKAQLA
jgi:hypothetical protein